MKKKVHAKKNEESLIDFMEREESLMDLSRLKTSDYFEILNGVKIPASILDEHEQRTFLLWKKLRKGLRNQPQHSRNPRDEINCAAAHKMLVAFLRRFRRLS